MKSCLVLECCPYHWEIFPNWVSMLTQTGFEVDIACPDTPGHLETLDMLGMRRVPVERFSEIAFDRYDFVVIGTLRHEGYAHDTALAPLPGLDLIERIGRPSISVVHEPVLWGRQRPAFSFDGIYSRDEGIVNLFHDHSYNWAGRWNEHTRWAWEEEKLILFENGERMEFTSTDGGASYRGQGNRCLRRRQQPRVDLKAHIAGNRHAVLTFSPEGSKMLSEFCPGTSWILPMGGLVKGDHGPVEDFLVAGSVDYERKAVPSLVQACATLNAGERVVVLGGSRSPEAGSNPNIDRLVADLTSNGVSEKVHFTGYLPYKEFIEHVCRSRFLLPLVDDRAGNGDFKSQMTGVFCLSLGLGIPMIMNSKIAEYFQLEFMVCYDGEDLASGLAKARSLDETEYENLCARTRAAARRQNLHNLDTLTRTIDAILSRGLA